MRKAGTLVALFGLMSAATARAEEAPPVAGMDVPSAAVARPRNTELLLSFLPMGLGSFSGVPGGMKVTADASFAYGFSISLRHTILRGLSIGITPQALFNVTPKDQNELPWPVSKQFDLLARVAYTFPVVESIALYAEAQSGYSLILPSDGDAPMGLVVAAGAGCAMDLTDRVFVDLGAGYQWGFQKLPAKDKSADAKTSYLRVSLGVGKRF